jgi:hypothetical protein
VQLDFLEHKSVNDVVVLSVVLEEARRTRAMLSRELGE